MFKLYIKPVNNTEMEDKSCTSKSVDQSMQSVEAKSMKKTALLWWREILLCSALYE